MDLRITGAHGFYLVAAACKDASRGDLVKELAAGLGASVKPVTAAIKTAAVGAMPSRGGYRQVLVPALNVTPRRQAAAGIRLTVSAKGRSEMRDVRALDRGQLRHPVYGRSRPGRRRGQRHINPWSVTAIPPGFVTTTFDRQVDGVVDRLSQAVQNVADKLAGS